MHEREKLECDLELMVINMNFPVPGVLLLFIITGVSVPVRHRVRGFSLTLSPFACSLGIEICIQISVKLLSNNF